MTAVRKGHPLRGVLIALALPTFALALLTGISGQTAPALAPSPAPISCPAQVAQDLGITYSPEEGVTEKLDLFHAELIYCEMRRQWICWDEENPLTLTGLERICGTPTQLNDALAAEVKIWWTDLSAPIRNHGCREDMPCWDCNRMGNRTCGGSDILPASPAIPSVGRYLAL